MAHQNLLLRLLAVADNAAMDETTRKRLRWAGLLIGILIGGFLNKAPDPFSDLIYCGIGATVGTTIGVVARAFVPKQP